MNDKIPTLEDIQTIISDCKQLVTADLMKLGIKTKHINPQNINNDAIAAREDKTKAAKFNTNAALDKAKAKLAVSNAIFQTESEEFSSQRLWKDKSKLDKAQLEVGRDENIFIKLGHSNRLIKSLISDNEKNTHEMEALFQKFSGFGKTFFDNLGDKDKIKYEKQCQKLKKDMQDLLAYIKKNDDTIARCGTLAEHYDDAKPENFPDYWLEYANVILERQDAYGFQGLINYRNLETDVTPGTGLAGYSVAYGAMLKKDEVINYTCPNTKINIERNASGNISDRTPYDDKTTEEEKNLAALKCAKLLWIDFLHRDEDTFYLEGPGHSLDQAKRVVAALHMLAADAGVSLERKCIKVKVPGWLNALGSDDTAYQGQLSSSRQVKGVDHYSKDMAKLIQARNATAEFKDLYEKIKPAIVEEEVVQRRPRNP